MTVKEIQTLQEQRAECPCDDCTIICQLCADLLNEIEQNAGADL